MTPSPTPFFSFLFFFLGYCSALERNLLCLLSPLVAKGRGRERATASTYPGTWPLPNSLTMKMNQVLKHFITANMSDEIEHKRFFKAEEISFNFMMDCFCIIFSILKILTHPDLAPH